MPAPDPLAPYDPVFQAAGTEWNVDPLLLKAMAGQESGGRPTATSSAGAQGLMQIMPQTQQQLGIKDPNDPVESIWGAAKYMNQALQAEGSPEGALLFYHGGPDWRQNYGRESQAYVPAIAARYKALLAAQPGSQPPGQQTPPAASVATQAPSQQAPAQQASR